ncbi:hypothetical protein HYV70_05530 [Candidatus Uhrbacteria bacterium]|nr:hypothetical protein [Candidatus Uhrbacteria bacterium]
MNELEYSDFYDRLTVKECRWYEEAHKKRLNEIPSDEPDRDEKVRLLVAANKLLLWMKKGERAAMKHARIREWIERDLRHQKLVDDTEPRNDISCLRCYSKMNFMDKHFDSSSDQERVILFYECPNGCLPRRAFFNDGNEYRIKPHTCTKCNAVVKQTSTRTDNIVTFDSVCESCGNNDHEEMDFSPKIKPIDEHFSEDRMKYCIDDQELKVYLESRESMKQMGEFVKRMKSNEEESKTTEHIQNIRKLRVIELQELLVKTLQDVGFTQVHIKNPSTSNGLRIQLSAFDTNKDRSDITATKVANSVLKTALQETNWRIVKSSVHSTLGALIGVLRGYVDNHEIRRLSEQENSKNA